MKRREPEFICAIDLTPVIEEYPALVFFPEMVVHVATDMAAIYLSQNGPAGLEDWIKHKAAVICIAGASMTQLSGDDYWGAH